MAVARRTRLAIFVGHSGNMTEPTTASISLFGA